MRQDQKHHEFSIPGARAVISTNEGEVEGYLEATGTYTEEVIHRRAFTGGGSVKNALDIASINGMFSPSTPAILNDPLLSYRLRFPLRGGTATTEVKCTQTDDPEVWTIESV